MTDRTLEDLNVETIEELITPDQLKAEMPLTPAISETVRTARGIVRDILDRQDHRLFLVVGPCSIHDTGAAMEYAHRLRRLADEGTTILVTTHYMLEAEHCDRLALLFAGRLVADAAPAALKREVEAEAGTLLEIACSQPLLAMEQLAQAGFRETALFGKHIHLLSPAAERDRARIPPLLAAGGIQVDSIAARPLSMEDVFVYRVTALERHAAQAGARA